MSTLDYSKADISRAKTADYMLGQSASIPFYDPNLKHSRRADQSYYDGRMYTGDASQYYQYAPSHPTQSYEQYAHRVQNSPSYSLNPKVVQREHYRSQLPQGVQHSYEMGQYIPYQNQYHAYYNQNTHYLPQQSSLQQVAYQRQFLSFRPMMGNQINQVAQSKYPLDQPQSYQDYDQKIFCPACHQQYFNSQVEQHIQRHYLYNTEQFKISQETTHIAQPQSFNQLTNQARFLYPLVEPQEFECKELDEVNYMNKYKLHHQELNKKDTNVKVKSQSTQFAKPPLQLRSQNTDIYNCLDNIFSSNNNFDVNDLTKSNTILAKKRPLDDWEKLRSQKEGYKIKNK